MSVRPASDDRPSGCSAWARGRLCTLLGSLQGCFDGVRSAVRLRRAIGPVGLAEVVERGTESELDAIESKFMEADEQAVLELIGDVLAREEPKYAIDGRWLTLSDGSPIGTVTTPTGAMVIQRLRCDVPQLLCRRVFLFSSSLVFSVCVARGIGTIHPERPLNRVSGDPLDGGCKRAILYLVQNTKF